MNERSGDKRQGNPIGRPSSYTPETGETICERIAEGESLTQICRDPEMPSSPTVYAWLADERRKSFLSGYARAREAQMEALAEEILEIADDATNDWTEHQNADGTTSRVVDHENIQRARLKVDARKWLMSKLASRKYGDRLDLTVEDKTPRTPEARRARIKELMAIGVANDDGPPEQTAFDAPPGASAETIN